MPKLSDPGPAIRFKELLRKYTAKEDIDGRWKRSNIFNFFQILEILLIYVRQATLYRNVSNLEQDYSSNFRSGSGKIQASTAISLAFYSIFNLFFLFPSFYIYCDTGWEIGMRPELSCPAGEISMDLGIGGRS